MLVTANVFPVASFGQERIENSSSFNQAEKAEFDQQGRELRNAIDKTYKQLIDTKTFVSNPLKGNDISNVVLRYMPIGISLDKAQLILEATGLHVTNTQKAQVPSNLKDNDIAAYLILDETFPCQTHVGIYINPKNSKVSNRIQVINVQEIEARIAKSCL
jgi:hypothetical protein